MKFYVGLHQPSDANRFERCMVSVSRLRERKADFHSNEWIMDSGAFTEISTHGRYRTKPEEYAEQVNRWARCGQLSAAVTQDWMCEPFITARTGMETEIHQILTVERYERLRRLVRPYLMPVLQGWEPEEYVRHVDMYGPLLERGAWAGVGSVCKRNGSPAQVEAVLWSIHQARPDLRLHGFGLKRTALKSELVESLLESSDSMAWSWSARRQGRNANDHREAQRYVERLKGMPVQKHLFWRRDAR